MFSWSLIDFFPPNFFFFERPNSLTDALTYINIAFTPAVERKSDYRRSEKHPSFVETNNRFFFFFFSNRITTRLEIEIRNSLRQVVVVVVVSLALNARRGDGRSYCFRRFSSAIPSNSARSTNEFIGIFVENPSADAIG